MSLSQDSAVWQVEYPSCLEDGVRVQADGYVRCGNLQKEGNLWPGICHFLTIWSSLFGSQAFDYLPVSAVESSALWSDTQPQRQVYLVFSSHLVSCIPLTLIDRLNHLNATVRCTYFSQGFRTATSNSQLSSGRPPPDRHELLTSLKSSVIMYRRACCGHRQEQLVLYLPIE